MSKNFFKILSIAACIGVLCMSESSMALKKCTGPLTSTDVAYIKGCFVAIFQNPVTENPGMPHGRTLFNECLSMHDFDAKTCNYDSGGFDSGSFWCNTYFGACKKDCKKAMASNAISNFTGGTNYPTTCAMVRDALRAR